MGRRKKKHYVNNEDFLISLEAYNKKVKEYEKEGKETPQLPDYIGECFMQIAEKLSSKPNFRHYSYREEMIMDGIENCLNCVGNFDTSKSKNPFSYFTQVIYFAFLRRIEKEKKQAYVKSKEMIHQMESGQKVGNLQKHDTSNFTVKGDSIYKNIYDFVEEYESKVEEKKAKKKKPKKKKALEEFLDE
jgi:chloramphenicol O-acetyltransferase